MQVRLPPGWEVRGRRQAPSVANRKGNALVHCATVSMPAERGDFGSGVVTLLGPDDVFVSLFEYDPEARGARLFSAVGLPRPAPSQFSPGALQRPLPGQSGGQWFFSLSGRAFCLHVVLGSHARRNASCTRLSALLDGLSIGADA